MKPSTNQIDIINHTEGALLVMAGAGSGKTRVLTERIKKLLSDPDGKFHVLALTFTNKAANEMKERLKDVKDIETRVYIGTIHGFCQNVIDKHGYAIGLNKIPQIFEKNEDRTSILIQVFEKQGNEDLKSYYVNKNPKEQQQFIYNALTYISLKKKFLKGVERFDILDKDLGNEKIQKMYNEYNDLLNEQNAMDFDDVIIYAYRIFAERPQIAKLYRKQYKYISVDEAQDLNFAQYEILKILCNGEHQNVLMVGDINQSLYHFNGSDIKYMKDNFIVDFGAKPVNLDVNYRSAKKIIEVANIIKPGAMVGYHSNINGRFQLTPCENEAQEANYVADNIQKIRMARKYIENNFEEIIEDKDIVILARNRYLFSAIEEELKSRKIPFYFKKGAEGLVLDSLLIKVFDLGLRILAYPFDNLHYIEITKELGIVEIQEIPKYPNGFEKLKWLGTFLSDEKKEFFSTLIEAWNSANNNFNINEALIFLKDYANSLEHGNVHETNLVEEPRENYLSAVNQIEKEREEILFDIKQFEDLWKLYARNTASELKSLQHFKTQMALGLIAPTIQEKGITLSTIHLSKGLEFKVVYIIGMDQGSLPYYKNLKAGGRTLEEEQNIFYVAATRAQRILNITFPKNRFMPWDKSTPRPQKPSQYLNNLMKIGL